jgi:RHS repeat-associated protein
MMNARWLFGVFLAAYATVQLSAQTASPADSHRYRVELKDEVLAGDPATALRELAATYGGTLESPTPGAPYVIDLSPARAEMLRKDARVRAFAELSTASGHANRIIANGAGSPPSNYSYDGAGNITAAGSDTYRYDTANRLLTATAGGPANGVSYAYDAFGNRTAATPAVGAARCVGNTDCDLSPAVTSATNRLTGLSYDMAGNLLAINGSSFTYDALSMAGSSQIGSSTLRYVYTADDERIATYDGFTWTWAIRDLGARPLREYTSSDSTAGSNTSYGTANLTWQRDYIWRGALMLASEARHSYSDPTQVSEHFHLDHLGTPRLVTDDNGSKLGIHTYYPFGGELDSLGYEQPEAELKFTGHARDTGRTGGLSLDDMHARYYSADVGRFLSIDPELKLKKILLAPQMWNRYAYVLNNPLNAVDPTGMVDDDYMDGQCSGCDDGPSVWNPFGVHPTAAFHEDDMIGQTNEMLSRKMQLGSASIVNYFREVTVQYSMIFFPGGGEFEEAINGARSLTTLSEAKTLLGAWTKRTFATISDSIRYHWAEHGAEVGAKNVLEYLRMAYNFAKDLSGARIVKNADGTVRYIRNGYYVIKDVAGKIISYGLVR